MKVDRSLEDVWTWKDKLSEERKDKSLKEIVKLINKNGEAIEKKYNLKLRVVSSPEELKLVLLISNKLIKSEK